MPHPYIPGGMYLPPDCQKPTDFDWKPLPEAREPRQKKPYRNISRTRTSQSSNQQTTHAQRPAISAAHTHGRHS
jgi:hypothetical protein